MTHEVVTTDVVTAPVLVQVALPDEYSVVSGQTVVYVVTTVEVLVTTSPGVCCAGHVLNPDGVQDPYGTSSGAVGDADSAPAVTETVTVSATVTVLTPPTAQVSEPDPALEP